MGTTTGEGEKERVREGESCRE